jgi:group I intron endonuclease
MTAPTNIYKHLWTNYPELEMGEACTSPPRPLHGGTMQGIVYRITNTVNGKIYVGQTTKTLSQRWVEHVYDSVGKRRRKHNSYLHLAIEKYGKESFITEVLNICIDKNSLDDVERFYIKALNTVRPNGYNISLGGTGVMQGRKMSAEAKLRISAGLKKAYAIGTRKPNGPIHTEESKKKISDSLKHNFRSLGRTHSEETKEKIRAAHLGRIFSDEHKLKLSISKKTYWEQKRKLVCSNNSPSA